MRNRNLGFAACLAIVGLTVACGGGGGSEGGDTLAQGEKMYKQTCALCHGPSGQGMDRLGKELIGNEFVALNSTSTLVDFLIEGRPATHPDNERGVDMPPRGGNPNLSDEDLAAIVGFIKTLK